MNKHKLASLLIGVASLSQIYGAGLSETNKGFFLVIGGDVSHLHEPIRFDERLVFLPYYDTNHGRVDVRLLCPDFRYSINVKMIGPGGKEVKKRGLCENWGADWNQLHSYKDSKLNPVGVCWPYQTNVWAGGIPLRSPNDIFDIEKPGEYTLEIQMQMFRHTSSTDPEEQYRNLIRFSPIKINVEKPPEAKANLSPAQTNLPAK